MKRNSTLKEEDVFDYYDDVLDLEPGETITTLFPFVSQNSHKLIYITQQDLNHLESIKKQGYLPKRIIIMPFIHERKIFTEVIYPE